jgi:dTDP-4-amino-4,6-dideoxygalactose transaminase
LSKPFISICGCYRRKVQNLLSEEGVKSTIYWPFHGEIDLAAFPGAAWIFEHIFLVPLDQHYGREDMEYLTKALKETAVIN